MQQHAKIMEATMIGNHDLRPIPGPRSRPVHSMLVLFSAAYFAGALVTDFVYWQTPDVLWERFSIWLISAGLVMAGLATIAFAINIAGSRQIDRPAWARVIGYALAVGLELISAFVHSRDGYTAVVPTGLMLSALVILVLSFTALADRMLEDHSVVGE
jgi:uncharacterized membrane protein